MKNSALYISLFAAIIAFSSCEDKPCTENDLGCSKSGIPQKCIEQIWVDQEPCEGNLICSLGKCVKRASDSSCTEYKTQCDNGIPQICKDGKWVNQSECLESEICIKGRCQQKTISSCVDGQLQCSDDGIPQVCNNRLWVDKPACTDGRTCLKEKGDCYSKLLDSCAGNATNCSKYGVPQVCNNGDWEDIESCDSTDEKCLKGHCVPKTQNECIDLDTQCNDDGVPQICQNGAWKSLDPCQRNWKCIGGTCLPNNYAECAGSSRCTTTGFIQTCESNRWADSRACENNQKCLDGHCVPKTTPECVAGTMSCSRYGSLLSCEDGYWVDAGQCDTSEFCYGGTCYNNNSRICEDGKTQCSGDLLVTCLDGRWNNGRSCPAGQRCLNGKCESYSVPDCTGSQTRCSPSGIPETCVNNKWEVKSICNAYEICQEGNCVDNTPKCSTESCKAMSDDSYRGDICIEHVWEGISCGCEGDEHCRTFFTCNTGMGYCSPTGSASYTDVIKFTIPASGTCENFKSVNNMYNCVKDNNQYTFNYFDGTVVEMIASNISSSMANLKSPGTDYYIEFTNIYSPEYTNGRVIEIVWQHGSVASKWESNKLKITDNKGKSKEFMANAQNTDMTVIFIPEPDFNAFKLEATGPNVVKIKSIVIRPKQSTDENPNTPEWCASKSTSLRVPNDPTRYTGNACMDTGCLTCGCNNNSECKEGYRCDLSKHICIDIYSEECNNMPDNEYFGSYYHPTYKKCICEITFYNGETNSTVDILDGSYTCKDGYTCRPDLEYCYPNNAPKTFTIDFETQTKCNQMQSITGFKSCDITSGSSQWMKIWFTNLVQVVLDTKYFNYKNGSGYLVSEPNKSTIEINNLFEGDTVDINWRVESNEIDPQGDSLVITTGKDMIFIENGGINYLDKTIKSSVVATSGRLTISAKESGITYDSGDIHDDLVRTYVESITVTHN